MSERKVLNKYYPPDFDPSKIPRMKLPKNRQYTVRLMAPFNMRCVTCGEYIYKGKKFNARKEDVEGQDYLGIRIYRFYIKCTRCLQEISFKTDPQNTDYEIEAGATRNFMALKLAEEQAQREEDERREDEATNPMKLLENRTKQSKQELELLESLEELRDLNRRQRSVDYDSMLSQYDNSDLLKKMEERQEAEDEKFIRSVFGSKKKVIEEQIIEDDVPFTQSAPLTKRSNAELGVNKSASNSSSEPARKIAKTSGNTSKLFLSASSVSSSAASFESLQSSANILSDQPKVEASKTSQKDLPENQTLTNSVVKPATSKPANTSWNLSIGSVGNKKSSLSNLVRVKKTADENKTLAPETTKASGSNAEKTSIPAASSNALSMLGSYSDSDSEGT